MAESTRRRGLPVTGEGAPGGGTPPALTAAEVAEIVEGRVEGDPQAELRGVAPVHEAGAGELAFLAHRSYLRHLSGASATAVLVPEELAGEVETVATRIVVDDAHLALARLLRRLHPPTAGAPTIHPTAVLGPGVRLGDDVHLGAYAVVGREARIGSGTRIGAHAVVGERCRIGDDVVVHAHATLYPRVVVGDRVIVHSGVRLGVDGFGYVFHEGEHRKIPQVGACVVADDVEIGANACVDRGSIGTTRIGEGTKLDNLVQIGHNVTVGPRVAMAGQVGVAGSATIGEGVLLGGQAGISGHLEVGDGARVGAQAGVIGDVDPGETVSGYPARPHGEAMRATGALFRLPGLLKRVREMERRLEALEEAAPGEAGDDGGSSAGEGRSERKERKEREER